MNIGSQIKKISFCGINQNIYSAHAYGNNTHPARFYKHCSRHFLPVALCWVLIFIPVLLCILPIHRANAQLSQIANDNTQLYYQGIDYMKLKNYVYAKELFTQFIQKNEMLVEKKNQTLVSNARFYRAICALELNQPDAEKLLLDYIELEDESILKKTAYYQLGRLMYENKKYKEAIEYFEKVDQWDLSRSERDEYKFELAYCYFFNKKLDEAYRLLRETKEVKNKYYYPSNYYYGYISYTKQNFDEALKSFERLRESKVYEKVIPYYIAQIYFQRRQYEKVIEYLQPLIGESGLKYYEELNLILGQAYYEMKNYEKSIRHIKVYLDKNKARKEELYQMGYAYYQTNQYEEAINYLKPLDNLTDSMGQSVMYILGDCFLKTGNKQNALSAFQKASRLQFNKFISEHATFNFAKLSYELGYDKQAINAFQSFIANFPDSDLNEEAKSLLSDLLLTTKNYKEALAIIETIQNKTPRVKRAYQQIAFFRALELYNDKNYQEAVRMLQTSLSNPIVPEIKALSYYWLGECNYQLLQYNTAFNEYNKFLQLAATTDIKDKNWYLANAHYAAGYTQFKQQDFSTAARYFSEAVSKLPAVTRAEAKSRLYPDARLRLADCYLVLKNYSAAISNYDEVIQAKAAGSDYALFQKATILGLQSRHEEKISTLEKIQSQFPGSAYQDDAQYQIGEAYLATGKNQMAINAYNNLIQKYPGSPLISRSWLKLGVVYYNMDNVKKAIECYQTVIDKFPKSNESREALLALKDISIAEGDPDLYMNIVSNRKDLHTTVAEQDSIAFLAAETRFAKGQCEEAVQRFNDYLNKFPSGYFNLEAKFYRSECLFRMKKYAESVKGYEDVANAGINIFREKSLVKAAEIHFRELKNYAQAEQYYQMLLENATTPENIYLANLGLLRCAYYQNKMTNIQSYAEKILQSNQSTPEQQIEANFYLGKYFLQQKSNATALSYFQKVASKTTNAMGAESQYYIAQIRFEENKLKEAEEECFRLIDNFSSYDHWYIKSYILLADIYAKKGNLFQAKATLQSVIENTDDEPLKNEALQKLNKIYEHENKTSRLLPEANGIDTPLDTIKMEDFKK
jgi:TolA-binding protein